MSFVGPSAVDSRISVGPSAVDAEKNISHKKKTFFLSYF